MKLTALLVFLGGILSANGLPHANGDTRGKKTECEFRRLSYRAALHAQPHRAPLLTVFDALELSTMCGDRRPAEPSTSSMWPRTSPTPTRAVYVDPKLGKDTNAGTKRLPFATVHKALAATRVGQVLLPQMCLSLLSLSVN